ncbi:MAG: hypothetical protein AAGG69_02995 [Pseudomonadota bacterium]
MNIHAFDHLDTQARDILNLNDRGGYTVPTAGLYPYQWNWDSAFAAWGFATFDINRAWVELETLFSGQWASGMVPHIIFHKVDPGYFPGPDVWGGVGPLPSSGISQPPVAASVARWMYEMKPAESEQRARDLFGKLAAWHQWFIDWRSDENGAICITHPWEAGRDNTPDWDGAMANITPTGVGEYQRRDTSHVDSSMRPKKEDYDRYLYLVQMGHRLKWDDAGWKAQCPFRVADPTMTFILLRAQRDLIALGKALGEDVIALEATIPSLEKGARLLWNDALGCYDARDVKSGEWSNCVSNASFLNWYAGITDPAPLDHYDRVTSLCRYPVPSHDPASSRFESKRYWRGPTWGMMNAMTGIGLAEQGMSDRAEALRAATRDVIANHGFAEYFDPLTGNPAGGQSFTWTAAIWLAWANRAGELANG